MNSNAYPLYDYDEEMTYDDRSSSQPATPPVASTSSTSASDAEGWRAVEPFEHDARVYDSQLKPNFHADHIMPPPITDGIAVPMRPTPTAEISHMMGMPTRWTMNRDEINKNVEDGPKVFFRALCRSETSTGLMVHGKFRRTLVDAVDDAVELAKKYIQSADHAKNSAVTVEMCRRVTEFSVFPRDAKRSEFRDASSDTFCFITVDPGESDAIAYEFGTKSGKATVPTILPIGYCQLSLDVLFYPIGDRATLGAATTELRPLEMYPTDGGMDACAVQRGQSKRVLRTVKRKAAGSCDCRYNPMIEDIDNVSWYTMFYNYTKKRRGMDVLGVPWFLQQFHGGCEETILALMAFAGYAASPTTLAELRVVTKSIDRGTNVPVAASLSCAAGVGDAGTCGVSMYATVPKDAGDEVAAYLRTETSDAMIYLNVASAADRPWFVFTAANDDGNPDLWNAVPDATQSVVVVQTGVVGPWKASERQLCIVVPKVFVDAVSYAKEAGRTPPTSAGPTETEDRLIGHILAHAATELLIPNTSTSVECVAAIKAKLRLPDDRATDRSGVTPPRTETVFSFLAGQGRLARLLAIAGEGDLMRTLAKIEHHEVEKLNDRPWHSAAPLCLRAALANGKGSEFQRLLQSLGKLHDPAVFRAEVVAAIECAVYGKQAGGVVWGGLMSDLLAKLVEAYGQDKDTTSVVFAGMLSDDDDGDGTKGSRVLASLLRCNPSIFGRIVDIIENYGSAVKWEKHDPGHPLAGGRLEATVARALRSHMTAAELACFATNVRALVFRIHGALGRGALDSPTVLRGGILLEEPTIGTLVDPDRQLEAALYVRWLSLRTDLASKGDQLDVVLAPVFGGLFVKQVFTASIAAKKLAQLRAESLAEMEKNVVIARAAVATGAPAGGVSRVRLAQLPDIQKGKFFELCGALQSEVVRFACQMLRDCTSKCSADAVLGALKSGLSCADIMRSAAAIDPAKFTDSMSAEIGLIECLTAAAEKTASGSASVSASATRFELTPAVLFEFMSTTAFRYDLWRKVGAYGSKYDTPKLRDVVRLIFRRCVVVTPSSGTKAMTRKAAAKYFGSSVVRGDELFETEEETADLVDLGSLLPKLGIDAVDTLVSAHVDKGTSAPDEIVDVRGQWEKHSPDLPETYVAPAAAPKPKPTPAVARKRQSGKSSKGSSGAKGKAPSPKKQKTNKGTSAAKGAETDDTGGSGAKKQAETAPKEGGAAAARPKGKTKEKKKKKREHQVYDDVPPEDKRTYHKADAKDPPAAVEYKGELRCEPDDKHLPASLSVGPVSLDGDTPSVFPMLALDGTEETQFAALAYDLLRFAMVVDRHAGPAVPVELAYYPSSFMNTLKDALCDDLCLREVIAKPVTDTTLVRVRLVHLNMLLRALDILCEYFATNGTAANIAASKERKKQSEKKLADAKRPKYEQDMAAFEAGKLTTKPKAPQGRDARYISVPNAEAFAPMRGRIRTWCGEVRGLLDAVKARLGPKYAENTIVYAPWNRLIVPASDTIIRQALDTAHKTVKPGKLKPYYQKWEALKKNTKKESIYMNLYDRVKLPTHSTVVTFVPIEKLTPDICFSQLKGASPAPLSAAVTTDPASVEEARSAAEPMDTDQAPSDGPSSYFVGEEDGDEEEEDDDDDEEEDDEGGETEDDILYGIPLSHRTILNSIIPEPPTVDCHYSDNLRVAEHHARHVHHVVEEEEHPGWCCVCRGRDRYSVATAKCNACARKFCQRACFVQHLHHGVCIEPVQGACDFTATSRHMEEHRDHHYYY
jgi:hypothetical protein